MIPLHYKGYKLTDPKQSGGKAGRGKNRTTSIQIWKGSFAVKHIIYEKNVYGAKDEAIEKARLWIEKTLTQGNN